MTSTHITLFNNNRDFLNVLSGSTKLDSWLLLNTASWNNLIFNVHYVTHSKPSVDFHISNVSAYYIQNGTVVTFQCKFYVRDYILINAEIRYAGVIWIFFLIGPLNLICLWVDEGQRMNIVKKNVQTISDYILNSC